MKSVASESWLEIALVSILIEHQESKSWAGNELDGFMHRLNCVGGLSIVLDATRLKDIINGDTLSYCFLLSSDEYSLLSENKGGLAKDPKVTSIARRGEFIVYKLLLS